MKINYLIAFCFLSITTQQYCAQAPAPQTKLAPIEEAKLDQETYDSLKPIYQTLSANRLEHVAYLCRRAHSHQNNTKLVALGQYLNCVANPASAISHTSVAYLTKHGLIDDDGNIVTQ